MSNFTTQHMSIERAEVLAAHMRVRGYPHANAMHEWARLSEEDRDFWRQDLKRVLAKVNIHVATLGEQRAS
jgi:hypothetical protein